MLKRAATQNEGVWPKDSRLLQGAAASKRSLAADQRSGLGRGSSAANQDHAADQKRDSQ